jgi:hypothetical protein
LLASKFLFPEGKLGDILDGLKDVVESFQQQGARSLELGGGRAARTPFKDIKRIRSLPSDNGSW